MKKRKRPISTSYALHCLEAVRFKRASPEEIAYLRRHNAEISRFLSSKFSVVKLGWKGL